MSAVAVNRNVRVEPGANGTVVVMSAHCERCGQDVMPSSDGRCLFCGSFIVDEDLLPVREMLAQIEERRANGGECSIEEAVRAEVDAVLGGGLEEASARAVMGPDSDGVSSNPPRKRGELREEVLALLADGPMRLSALANHFGYASEQFGSTVRRYLKSGHIIKVEKGLYALPEESEREPSGESRDGDDPPAATATVTGQDEPGHDQAPPSRSENDRARTAAWKPDEIIKVIQEWAIEHGEPPTSNEWTRRIEGCPTTSTVVKHFGSWNAAITAAGFEPRPQASPATRPPLPRPPARIRVRGTGLSYESPEAAYLAADEIEADGERVAGQARFDGDEPKAEQAIDQSRELAQKIRNEALAFEERRNGSKPAHSHMQDLHEAPEQAVQLLVTPEEMAPFQRSLVLALIAGMRAAADALEQELAA